MKRRQFVKLGSVPLLMHGLQLRTFASPSMVKFFTGCEGISDRILVIIQMSGGNDGVNTTVALDQYDLYANLRSKIKLPQNSLIKLQTGLASNQQIGLHPSLTGFKSLYDQGKLNIIQGVSYNQPNLSHFKSTDLILSGGDGTPDLFNLTSGWMGRYLDSSFPGKAGNPNAEYPDPLGIQVGDDRPSSGFITSVDISAAVNIGWNDPAGYYNQVVEIGGAPPTNFPNTDYGSELDFLTQVQNNVSAYAGRISEVFNKGKNFIDYPDNSLAYQLKSVARMISGGSKTKIFLVNTYGYDTHTKQVEASDPTLGEHADRLFELSNSIKSFVDDLVASKQDHRVLGVTFSEFGRKPAENANLGTDHGTIAPMFLIGTPTKGGVTGINNNFSKIEDELFTEVNIDYRRVLTTILQDWLGASTAVLSTTLFDSFQSQKLDIINPVLKVDPACLGNFSPLPIKLISFDANLVNDQQVECKWITAFETENSRFEVQRSRDGQIFSTILLRKGDGIGESETFIYGETDQNPLFGISYYRLKTIDNQGIVEYSMIRKIERKSKEEKTFKIYPNPAIFEVNIVLSSRIINQAEVLLIDQSGRQIMQKHWPLDQGFNKLNLDITHLSPGNYFIQVMDRKNINMTTPISIVR